MRVPAFILLVFFFFLLKNKNHVFFKEMAADFMVSVGFSFKLGVNSF